MSENLQVRNESEVLKNLMKLEHMIAHNFSVQDKLLRELTRSLQFAYGRETEEAEEELQGEEVDEQ